MKLTIKEEKKVIALDIGRRYVGIARVGIRSKEAIADAVIKGDSRKALLKRLSQYLKNFSVQKLVVGLPLNEDMLLTSEAFFILNFINQLKKEVKAETIFVDEYASSVEAQERNLAYRSRKRKKRVDNIAAKILLEQFLKKEAAVIPVNKIYRDKAKAL